MFVAIVGSYLLVASLGLLLGWTAAARFDMPGPLPELLPEPWPPTVCRVVRPRRWACNGAAYDWQAEPDADRWGAS